MRRHVYDHHGQHSVPVAVRDTLLVDDASEAVDARIEGERSGDDGPRDVPHDVVKERLGARVPTVPIELWQVVRRAVRIHRYTQLAQSLVALGHRTGANLLASGAIMFRPVVGIVVRLAVITGRSVLVSRVLLGIVGHVLVSDEVAADAERRQQHVEQGVVETAEVLVTRELAERIRVELLRTAQLSLEEHDAEEEDELGSKSATVPEYKSTQVREVGNGKVTEGCCLSAFLAHDADANGSSLDHVYVVGSVTDGKSERARVILHDIPDGSCFVVRRRSIDNNRAGERESLHDLLSQLSVFKGDGQTLTGNHEARFGLLLLRHA